MICCARTECLGVPLVSELARDLLSAKQAGVNSRCRPSESIRAFFWGGVLGACPSSPVFSAH